MFRQKPISKPRQVKSTAVNRSAVNTYYRGDKTAKQSPFDKKPPIKPVRKYVFGVLDFVLLGAVLLALVYSLAINSSPKIKASSYKYHDVSVYEKAASEQLSSIRNRNKISFDQQGMAAALQKQFPEISAVQTELPLFSEQPTVRLSISKPSFYIVSQGRNYVVSDSGKAVAESNNLPRVKGLLNIQDQSGYKLKPGQQILSESSVAFINTLIAECQHAGVQISSLTLPQTAQELDLRAKDQPYYVKFYLGGDALNETGQYLAARNNFNRSQHQPAQYLDVRVDGKIFYK